MSFTSRQGCECYKKLHIYGIPLRISDENEFLSEYSPIISYEHAFSLPGTLKINEDITEYPVVEDNELSFVFQEMGEVIPSLSDFDKNVLSFYILDMIIEGLWTAQNQKMSFYHQKATLLWILYFFNYIQKQNPTRKDLFDHLKIVLFCNTKIKDPDERSGETDKILKSDDSKSVESNPETDEHKLWALPLPPDYNKNDISSFSPTSEENVSVENTQEEEKSSESLLFSDAKNQNQTETNVNHMKIILEILYRIFARLWAYLEIQTVFHSMPPAEQVDLPFDLNTPKPLFKSESLMINKSGKRQSGLEKPSDGAETLMSFKNDFILPLQMSEEAKYYMKMMFPQNSQRSNLGKIKEEKNKK